MRTRSMGEITDVNTPETRTSTCDNLNVVKHTGYQGQTTITTDVVTPDFHKRSANGEIFNNPFTKVTVFQNSTIIPFSLTAKDHCGTGKDLLHEGPYGHLTTTPSTYHTGNPFETDGSQLRTLASTQAASNIAAPDVSFMVELAELPEAIAMTKHPLDQIRYVVNDAKRSKTRIQRGLSVGQFIASNWLAYRYGLIPSMSSLSAATDLIKGRGSAVSERMTARGYAQNPTQTDLNVSPGRSGAYFQQTKYTETTQTASCRAGFLYQLDLSSFSHWGSFHQWPSTIYELIPYSFVVDWFGNLGDYLSAMEYKPGVKVLASWTTLEIVTTQRTEHVAVDTPGRTSTWITNQLPNAIHDTTTVVKSRVPGARLGIAPKIDPFGIRSIPNGARMMDAISLIYQQLRS